MTLVDPLLRALIDSELCHTKGRMVGEVLAEAFAELTHLYTLSGRPRI